MAKDVRIDETRRGGGKRPFAGNFKSFPNGMLSRIRSIIHNSFKKEEFFERTVFG